MAAKANPAPAEPLSKGETTRAKLIETAHGLFLQKGFHGTSLRDIAEAAGVAVGGIYNHFKDKDEIFAAVLDAYHPYHTIFPAVQAIEAESAEDYVHAVARQVYTNVTDAETQLLPLLFIELVEFQGRHFKQLVGKIVPAVLNFVDRLNRLPGRVRKLPPPLLFRTFMGMLIGVIVGDMLLKDLPFFKQIKNKGVDDTVDIFLHGIMEPEG